MATVRLMAEPDIPFAMGLKNLLGWNQTPDDWFRYLRLNPEGCFVATEGSMPVGTTTTLRLGPDLGWISMVAVLPEHRGHGTGRMLNHHAIRHLERLGVRSILLDATPEAAPLYRSLGFADAFAVERHLGTAPVESGVPPGPVDVMRPEDFEAVVALDHEAFGPDRRALLWTLAEGAQGQAWVLRAVQGIDGFVYIRPGVTAGHIASLVARVPEAARLLFRVALGALGGRAVLVDCFADNPLAQELLRTYGFQCRRRLTRMVRGASWQPPHRDWLVTLAGVDIS